ncbi:MAG TPA: hypothetical protein VK687_00980 [Bryobacteraceae bacterium]|nr:hypothetical protein [Bryobacteraceae bacterium]
MRSLLLMLATAEITAGQSHPSWWNYVSPDATALVGIQWEQLRNSILADAVGAELSSGGSLGFPDLPCLNEGRQILISYPELLAIATGSFPAAATREQAVRIGLKPVTYRGVDLWVASNNSLSVAHVSDTLLLIGQRKTLEAAIGGSLSDSIRSYSPLLARGARLSQDWDLWIATSRMPNPLASVFVPLEIAADAFEGGVTARDSLQLGAAYQMGSAQQATAAAEKLRQAIPSFPWVAQALEVQAEDDAVLLTLYVGPEQLAASLRPPDPVPEAPPPESVVNGPRVIRIYGLDGGPRETVLSPWPGSR